MLYLQGIWWGVQRRPNQTAFSTVGVVRRMKCLSCVVFSGDSKSANIFVLSSLLQKLCCPCSLREHAGDFKKTPARQLFFLWGWKDQTSVLSWGVFQADFKYANNFVPQLLIQNTCCTCREFDGESKDDLTRQFFYRLWLGDEWSVYLV